MAGSGGMAGAPSSSSSAAATAQQWLIGVQAVLQRHGLRARKWLTLGFLVTVWYYFSYVYNTNLKSWLSATQPGYQQAHGGAVAQPAALTYGSNSTDSTGVALATAAGTSVAEAEYQRQHELAVEASWLSPITLPLLLAIFSTTTAATLPWVLHAAASSPQLLPAWRRLWTHHTLDMALMCASTVFGTAAITVVYEYGSIQLVQVARSIGPLFTTGWAVLLLDHFTYGKPLLCLLATLGGTMLASWKEPTMCIMTLVLMIAANTCMTFRNVITRRLLSVLGIGHGHGHSKPEPPAAPQQEQQQNGAAAQGLVTPRSRGPHHAGHGSSSSSSEEQQHLLKNVALARSPSMAANGPAEDFSHIPPTHMASLLLTTGNATGVVALLTTLVLATFFDPKAASLVTEMHPGAAKQLMILGGTNWAYNLASQLVLAQLTVVAHGMLELLKRVFVLVAVSIYAQKAHWQWHNVMGACITFLAAALYFHYSHQQKQAAALKAHRSEHLEASSPFATPHGSQIRVGNASSFMRLIKSFLHKQPQQQQQDHLPQLDQDAGRKGAGASRVHLGASPEDDEECIVTLKSVHQDGEDEPSRLADGQPIKIIASSHQHHLNGGAASNHSSGGGSYTDAAAVVHIKAAGGSNGSIVIQHSSKDGEGDNVHHRSGKQGTAFAGYAGSKPYGDRSPPHHGSSASQQPSAPTGCAACLPPAGAPRLNLARSIVITIMLFTIPLLVPLGSWPYIVGSQPRPAVLAGYRVYHLPAGTSITGNVPFLTSTNPTQAALAPSTTDTTTTAELQQGDSGNAASNSPADSGNTELPVDDEHGAGMVPDVERAGGSGSGGDDKEQDPQQRKRGSRRQLIQQAAQRQQLRQRQQQSAVDEWSWWRITPNPRRRTLRQVLFGEDTGVAGADVSGMQVQLVPVSTVVIEDAELQGNLRTITASAASGTTSVASDNTAGGLKQLLGFYVGWLGHNNLGDEIVADIFYDLLKQMVEERVPQGATVDMPKELDKGLDRKYAGCGYKGHHLCHFAVLGGGSTVDAAFVMAATDMLRNKRPVMLWGSGYQRVHHNPKIQAEALEMLMNADVLGGIRGYITKDFLLVRTNRTLPVIGDSGFLSGAMYSGSGLSLPEVPNLPDRLKVGQPIPNWPPPPECLTGPVDPADEAPGGKCARPLAVVTLRSELTNYDLSKDAQSLKDADDIDQMRVPRHPVVVMMLVIAELVNEHHFQVVLQDVDDKSLAAHTRYLDIINKRIQPGKPPVVLHRAHESYQPVMDLYERAAVSINCRLHSGVLAASALRPIVYMASLPKFADFMSSIGQENFLVNPESPELKPAHTTDLAKLMVSKVLQAAQDAGPISASLERVRDAMMSKYKQAVRDMLDRMAKDNPERYRQAITSCMSVKITRSSCVLERTIINVECAA